ncbi:putative oxygenase MesX [Auritidibacter ignavus]|uniref:putative oxygenase MesX n=1 Tax=Auritidibacter ignavus TaxID=678932 RepID=UPI002FE596AE
MTEVTFSIDKTRFDENYKPLEGTRLTTNFANLARGENRQQNLRNALNMINNRFNELANLASQNNGADNTGDNTDRYRVELDIVSVNIELPEHDHQASFPVIEMLETTIVDNQQDERIPGVVGNNFSSYVRDYDFSILARQYAERDEPLPQNFGVLHGNIFKGFLQSAAYQQQFTKLPVICISASTKKSYHRTEHEHPALGVEYQQNEFSRTDEYFAKMGMKVRYFMPPQGVAPLAFYHFGDLLQDYTDLELISTIATMETFQRIYRPEVYNAHTPAGEVYQPSLEHTDFSPTEVAYDREERSRLGVEQGEFAQEQLITPHRDTLEQWSCRYADYYQQP